MSGGHFDYQQHYLRDMIEEIEQLIEINGDKERGYNLSERDIAEFRKGIVYLKIAYIYAQRIDWYVSGDDGDESFHERLKEELDELRKHIRSKKPVEKWLAAVL